MLLTKLSIFKKEKNRLFEILSISFFNRYVNGMCFKLNYMPNTKLNVKMDKCILWQKYNFFAENIFFFIFLNVFV